MRRLPRALLVALLLASSLPTWAQSLPASLDVHWNEGAADCAATPPPPIQVHRYDAQTFILRENPCATFEAPFLYLLLGSSRALLIDTGAVADPAQMPLAQTVMALLPGDAASKLPLLVVHTHAHQDHRAGDPQFRDLPGVDLVDADLDSVRRYFGFTDWPNGQGHIDLGGRLIDVLPTPGHAPAHVAFYDHGSALFLSGDFLLPGRLLIDDTAAYRASAKRVADFVKDRPLSHVLGAHVELDSDGAAFDWGSTYHPHERALQLTKADLLALPAALDRFNGFYGRSGLFILSHPLHNLIAVVLAALVVLGAAGWALRRYLRRRRRA